MFGFFKDAHFRKIFYKGIPVCILLGVFVIARALGRHGHMDETSIYFLVGVIVFCIFILMWILDHNFKKTSKIRTRQK